MTTPDPTPDHCTCPMDTPCRCGFAAMMSTIFFGDDA